MTIRNLKQAEAALLPYVPLVKQLTGQDTTLERIRPLMELLGNPQDRLRTIHIAGTSGKTSTAYYASALLVAGGQKVGLAVSPHVDTITERAQINGSPLPEAEFCQELAIFLVIVQQADLQPSYFELLYAFAIWLFERRQVDYAVIETGMGGLHDATNIAGRPDKVCVLTDIGFDHTRVLGNTLPAITAQKVGIVHDQNHVFMYEQSDEIMQVVEHWTAGHKAPLHLIETNKHRDYLGAMPGYQQRNWWLAFQVYEYLRNRDNMTHLTRQVSKQTQLVRIPGRMEITRASGKTLIMDGAHNKQKMAAFITSFQQLYPNAKPAILLAFKQGKDYQDTIEPLAALASRIITTQFITSQDLPAISMDSEVLAQAFRAVGVNNVQSIPDHQTAFRALLNSPENIAIITGSFYLLSQIRNNK